MTRVALAGYGEQIQKANPSVAKRQFIYRLRRTDFEKQYGRQYMRPSFGDRILGFLLDILPKIGPLSGLKLHLPNGDEQTQYLASFNTVENAYRAEVAQVSDAPLTNPPPIPELDFDTGAPTTEGEYKLADQTYAQLVEHLAKGKNAQLTPALLADINHFYADPQANFKDALRAKPKSWAELQTALTAVRQMPLAPPASPLPATHTATNAVRSNAAQVGQQVVEVERLVIPHIHVAAVGADH
jgi:hypothetical protein